MRPFALMAIGIRAYIATDGVDGACWMLSLLLYALE